MGRIVIDISGFDNEDSTRVSYRFEEKHLSSPVETVNRFKDAPESFCTGKYLAILTESQNEQLLEYLKQGQYHYDNRGDITSAEYLLAFSFGENPDVNMELARIVKRLTDQHQGLKPYVQWEIANIMYLLDPETKRVVRRIDLDCDKDYITTDGVIDKFKEQPGIPSGAKVFVVSQAWHAPRCFKTCERKELNVVGGEFSEEFSASDPQKWVRNVIAWVLKEGTRKKQ